MITFNPQVLVFYIFFLCILIRLFFPVKLPYVMLLDFSLSIKCGTHSKENLLEGPFAVSYTSGHLHSLPTTIIPNGHIHGRSSAFTLT